MIFVLYGLNHKVVQEICFCVCRQFPRSREKG